MITVGRYTYGLGNILTKGDLSDVRIGSFCSIGYNLRIFLGANHRVDWVTTYPFGHREEETFPNFDGVGHPHSKGDVVIGSDVWIGDNVTIMSGVRVGNGAVLATNAHIVKDVPDYAIVGGNPAELIRYRFTPAQIEGLLATQWWALPDERINELLPLLCSGDVDALLDAMSQASATHSPGRMGIPTTPPPPTS